MKNVNLDKLAKAYIINAIDSECYKAETKTDTEKLSFLYLTFKKEYCYPENLRRYGSELAVFSEWIMGAPSIFNIDFENYRILEIAYSWDSISSNLTGNAKETREDLILSGWFRFIANKTFQLFKTHKII